MSELDRRVDMAVYGDSIHRGDMSDEAWRSLVTTALQLGGVVPPSLSEAQPGLITATRQDFVHYRVASDLPQQAHRYWMPLVYAFAVERLGASWTMQTGTLPFTVRFMSHPSVIRSREDLEAIDDLDVLSLADYVGVVDARIRQLSATALERELRQSTPAGVGIQALNFYRGFAAYKLGRQ